MMENEKRLIDANALGIGKAKREAFDNPAYADGWNSAIAIIEQAPTVDAVEVVHGEWSTIEDDYSGLIALHCSVCNQEWWFEDDVPIKHYHYCPNCGAKMDGDG